VVPVPDLKYGLTTVVRPEEDGLMVKDIIYGRLDLGRGLIRRMKRGGGVFLNGKRDYLTRRVKAGDEIRIVFYEEKTELEPQAISLDIVYEDDYLLVVNKPAGMAVHPTGRYQDGTLANALAHHWQAIGLEAKVRLVHRLDRDTSGLIMVAKEPYSLQRLLQQLRTGEFVREYLGIVEGRPEPSQGTISAAIGRSLEHGVKRVVSDDGKAARTYYRTIATRHGLSLVRLRLDSGRTHQIRVHLADLGYPLVGDPLYSSGSHLDGQALHAWRLEFIHPRTLQRQTIHCPLPAHLVELWKEGKKGDRVSHA
jgi:23S rRNA pseudouridine1911/1915/1917 synthase